MSDPPHEPKRAARPLDYESPSRFRTRGMVLTLCIVAAIYGVAAFFACRDPESWPGWLIFASIIAAPIVGIQFGVTDRQNWL